MSDLKDHDPDEGPWLSPFHLMVGKIKVENPTLTQLLQHKMGLPVDLPPEVDDNPNLVRGYN